MMSSAGHSSPLLHPTLNETWPDVRREQVFFWPAAVLIKISLGDAALNREVKMHIAVDCPSRSLASSLASARPACKRAN